MLSEELEIERVVPSRKVRAALGVIDRRTFKRVCADHNIPITVIGHNTQGLTTSNFRLLLERMTNPVEAR